jgi:ubiquitin carboxyl-terminal hydrolase 40
MGAFLLPESMDGDNKIFCDACDQKRDMWLGTKLKALPNILVFTFRRFEFDYERMDRVKINDFFRFDLEHSFNHYLDCKEGQEFELYGVLIHRGSAHGGHYICYLRDIMQESDWENSLK